MYHHEPKTREETYAVMPRRVGKEGSGGYGMGVAPHAGYDQTPTVVGLRDHYMPQSMDELAPMTLKHMKKAHPTEFDRCVHKKLHVLVLQFASERMSTQQATSIIAGTLVFIQRKGFTPLLHCFKGRRKLSTDDVCRNRTEPGTEGWGIQVHFRSIRLMTKLQQYSTALHCYFVVRTIGREGRT